jgi:tetratricopeptide (TPR) repeat protein
MNTSPVLLNEDEAAFKLGITKRLLNAYARSAPKRRLGDNRTLKTVSKDGKIWFTPEDLDEWEEYLQKPWAAPGESRPNLPPYIDRHLEVECGGKCARCGKGGGVEVAHIDKWELSRNYYHHNLIRLCKACHSEYDSGLIPKEEILELKAALVQKVRESLQEGKRIFARGSVHRVPLPDSLFVGREKELLILNERLCKERVIVIEGIGGMGKTQLLLRALQQIKDIPTFWFDVESYQSLADLKLAILPALIKQGMMVSKTESLFDTLDTLPLRIVFDGLDRIPVAEFDDLVDFLNALIQLTRQPRLVVTTQVEINNLDGPAFKLVVPPLGIPESKQLMISGCAETDTSFSEDDITWLADFCDGHSLSLRAVTGLLRYYKKSSTVIERLMLAGANEVRDHARTEQNRSSSLQVCLRAAYFCFNHEQKRLLLYLSNFPAGCPEPMAKGWEKSSDFDADLAKLRRFFFVEIRPDNLLIADRLRLLNPVRQFIRSEWAGAPYDEVASVWMDAARTLMLQAVFLDHAFLIQATEPGQAQYGLLRLESELPNFLDMLRYAQEILRERESEGLDIKPYYELIAGLTGGLSRYFFIRGLLLEGMYFIAPGIKALLALERHHEAAKQLLMLANMQARMADYKGHTQTIGALVDLAGKTSDDHILALTSLGVGDIYKYEGKYSEAIKCYEQAVSHFREELSAEPLLPLFDEKDERYLTGMLGLALTSLAEVYHRLKQPTKAIQYGLEAKDCIEKTGDQTNLGVVWHELGNSYAESGDMAKAIEAYHRALISFLQLGYREYVGNAVCEMGEAVVEGGFDPALNSLLTQDVLRVVLGDIKEYLKRWVSYVDENFVDDGSAMRKLFGTIKLVSFTDNAWMLKDWVEEIRDEVLEPLAASEQNMHDPQYASFVKCLFLVIRPAHLLGVICTEEGRFTDEQIFNLCGLCYELASFWIVSNPFDWLAALLRYRGIAKNVDSKQLYAAFESACERDDPSLFSLK